MQSHKHEITNSNASPGDDVPPPETVWDPCAVQKLVSDAYRRGETPVVLCVGRHESAALKTYLSEFFDDEVFYLKNLVYAGLKIVELRVDSHLQVETLRSIYKSSRHAEQLKIRQAMDREQRQAYGAIPIRGAGPQPKPRTK